MVDAADLEAALGFTASLTALFGGTDAASAGMLSSLFAAALAILDEAFLTALRASSAH